MTDNSTWAGMIAMGLRYFIFCEPCDRSVELDMTQLPPDGNALNRSWPCKVCGRLGQVVISARGAERCVPSGRPDPLLLK
jgi:ribosomal protein S14